MQMSSQFDQTQVCCPELRMPKSSQGLVFDLSHARKAILVSPLLNKLSIILEITCLRRTGRAYHQRAFADTMHNVLNGRLIGVTLEEELSG